MKMTESVPNSKVTRPEAPDTRAIDIDAYEVAVTKLQHIVALLEPIRFLCTEYPDDADRVSGDTLWAIESLAKEATAALEVNR